MPRQQTSALKDERVIARALLLLAASTVGCARMQNACIYRPAPYPEGDWSPAGLEYEDAWFTSQDGTRLHGWYVPCDAPEATILFAHGIRGNVTSLAPQLLAFCQRHQVSVMVFDYRGYGRSDGAPDEQGLYDDATAARAWLAEREGVRPSDIVLMGRSIGAAVMVDLAARDGARGLILESAFTSLPDVVEQHTFGVPVDWLLACRFASIDKVSRYHGPLLMCHGELDSVIGLPQGRELFNAANEPKRFVTVAGADHQDPPDENWHRMLDKFLASLRPVDLVRLPRVESLGRRDVKSATAPLEQMYSIVLADVPTSDLRTARATHD